MVMFPSQMRKMRPRERKRFSQAWLHLAPVSLFSFSFQCYLIPFANYLTHPCTIHGLPLPSVSPQERKRSFGDFSILHLNRLLTLLFYISLFPTMIHNSHQYNHLLRAPHGLGIEFDTLHTISVRTLKVRIGVPILAQWKESN